MTDIIENKDISIPSFVTSVLHELADHGHQAVIVGGPVRDMLMGITPDDWDIATSATPEEMLEIFNHAHYENDFGTVTVVNDDEAAPDIVEVTTFRSDAAYTDNRRPDAVEFTDSLEEDLQRRDFTVNALAISHEHVSRESICRISRETVTDTASGYEDLHENVIRTMGEPEERFDEDALRMMRAVRFATTLDFDISQETKDAIVTHATRLESIAVERIRDEFNKMIKSDNPKRGILLLDELDLLEIFLPELSKTKGIDQNQAHSYGLFEHLINALQATADKDHEFHVRLAALFHDIGKVATRRYDEEAGDWTFYGHEVVGSRVTRKIMKRLKYPNQLSKTVVKLVRWHMFFSDPDEISLSAVRRLLRQVGKEHIWDLMKLRVADRIGMGRPKENPYRLRKFKSMIEEVMRDPVSVSMLEIDGDILMNTLHVEQGPRIGYILHALLEEVLEDPSKNQLPYLKERAQALNELGDQGLQELGEHGEEVKRREDERQIKEIRSKYWVE